jgi:hypothetical protein
VTTPQAARTATAAKRVMAYVDKAEATGAVKDVRAAYAATAVFADMLGVEYDTARAVVVVLTTEAAV